MYLATSSAGGCECAGMLMQRSRVAPAILSGTAPTMYVATHVLLFQILPTSECVEGGTRRAVTSTTTHFTHGTAEKVKNQCHREERPQPQDNNEASPVFWKMTGMNVKFLEKAKLTSEATFHAIHLLRKQRLLTKTLSIVPHIIPAALFLL